MSKADYGKLYLIPNFLSEDNSDDFLPGMVARMVHHIKNYVVESEKQGRALIKKLRIQTPQAELKIWLLNEHTKPESYGALLESLLNEDAAIISDAGLPCIADPGSVLVSLAQQKGIEVIPLPGASSIFMALMGSGFNGQTFTFHGYIPLDKVQRTKKIKEMELTAQKGHSQIFMETPYRNVQLLKDLLGTCNKQSKLCIGRNLSASDAWVKTKSIQAWGSENPDIHKIPCIFILGS